MNWDDSPFLVVIMRQTTFCALQEMYKTIWNTSSRVWRILCTFEQRATKRAHPHVTLFNKPHTCAQSANRRRHICANAIEEARVVLWCLGRRWFSQFLTISVWFSHWSRSLRFSLPVFPFYPRRGGFAARVLSVSLLSLSLFSLARPRVDSPPVVAALSAVFPPPFRWKQCARGFTISSNHLFPGPKSGMRAERESKTWDNYSMLPELLHHAGWILPVWLLKIIGRSHREEPLAPWALSACTRDGVCTCARVREEETWPYDSRTPIHWFMYVTFMDQDVGRKYGGNSWAPRAPEVVCCTYLHKHSPLSKWTTRIRRGCLSRQILINENAWAYKIEIFNLNFTWLSATERLIYVGLKENLDQIWFSRDIILMLTVFL